MDNKEESKHQVDADNLERFPNDISELHQSRTVGRSFRLVLKLWELILKNIKVEADNKRAKDSGESEKAGNTYIEDSVNTRLCYYPYEKCGVS